MLYRKIQEKIADYLKGNSDKILLIDGARQIGKSFIIREMCKKYYDNYIEINFASDYNGEKIFEKIKSKDDFYIQLSAIYGSKMIDRDHTIIFLDEIQIYPHMLTMLKDLKEDNKYRYITSGSLLGVTLKHTFIPMGAIDEIKMYPLDFEEFLLANGVGNDVIDHMRKSFLNVESLNEALHERILNLFKYYLIVGGLPDSVNEFVNNKNIAGVRKIQNDIYGYYKDDASQYDREHKLKIMNVYEMMISCMENKVKRLMLTTIDDGKQSRFEKYKDEFDYLLSSQVALGTLAIAEPKFPLVQSKEKNLIKLYYNDVGILTNLLYKNNINAILSDDSNVNLGAVYETVVAQELKCHSHELFYYDRRKVGEIDYLIDDYDNLCPLPIEVKSGRRGYEYSAIKKVLDDDNYNANRGYIFSNDREVKQNDKIINYPIYYIMFI